MLNAESYYHEMINNVSREIRARVELLDGSTLLNTFTYDGALQSFTVERLGDSSKFFGYGICQKLTVKLRDKDRSINIQKGQSLDVAIGVGCDYLYTCPVFFVDEVQRDENTNALTIVAYDAIYRANKYKVSDMTLPQSYSVLYFVSAASAVLGMPLKIEGSFNDVFNTTYPNGANFAGTESIREALDDVAEITGTIYYMNNNWELTFKTLDKAGDPVLTIDKSKYFTLSAKTSYNLEKLTHTTELGDNITFDTNTPGTHQYLRDNAFLTTYDDAHTVLEKAFNQVSGLTINQFDLKWRGNFLLELGDKIGIVTKDNETIYSYLLNDTITYNGGLVENTSWSYTESPAETESNPGTIGETLKKTYARVDKLNGEISLVAKETREQIGNIQEEVDVAISEIRLTSDNITATVEQNAVDTSAKIENLEQNLDMVTDRVESTMTSSEVELLVSRTINKGASSVKTSTGFTFNDEGLTVSKSSSEISTTISEDGMTVYRNEEAMLKANNLGVEANNLRSNYIIISNRCRFEKYGKDRAGCYWIGGGEE